MDHVDVETDSGGSGLADVPIEELRHSSAITPQTSERMHRVGFGTLRNPGW